MLFRKVFQDINAGRVNGYYSSGENGVITTYARNTAWHASTTYSARTQIIPRYTIDDVAVLSILSVCIKSNIIVFQTKSFCHNKY